MRHNKLRTALTGLSVAWGIFMLITLVSAANAIIRSFEENMMNSDNQKISVWGGVTTKPYRGYREGRSINLKNDDINTLSREQRDVVEEVTSELNGRQSGVATNTTYVEAGFTGVFPSARDLNRLDMVDGRFISQADLDNKTKVMVLPKEYAEQLFPPDGKKAVGQRVDCIGLSFLVVGVYESRFRTIYIPYTTAQVFASDNTDLDQIVLLLKGVTEVEQADKIEEDIRQTLASTHGFDPDDESGVWIWNAVSNALTVQGGMSILNIGVWILGLLTLLSGIIGISNIMFVSVKERTHEIGIRRAIGAKPVKILTQILTESVVITTLFGYIGIVLGTVLTEVLAANVGDGIMDYAHVDLGIAAQVTAVLIVAGALAGLFPALRALKVKPVEALRDE